MTLPATSRSTRLDVGDAFGPYEIVARLAGGGMATVFLARRRGAKGFSRPVAIKVVHPHLADAPGFIDMLIDEAKLAAKIQHPNVVHVEELGERDGSLYLVMEYVVGCSLSELLRARSKKGTRIEPEHAVWMAMQALGGLHAAHEIKDAEGQLLGLVHRDVSPQNILLSTNGNVKVIDFGIAKARGRHYQSETGSLKGKIRYMAPEQLQGEPVDRRTDLYAMAIVLWEMLTLQKLFEADNEFLLMDLVRDPKVKPPSTIGPGIDPKLDATVLKALSPDPNDRYATALEFRRALARAVPAVGEVDSRQIADLLDETLGSSMAERQAVLDAGATDLDAGKTSGLGSQSGAHTTRRRSNVATTSDEMSDEEADETSVERRRPPSMDDSGESKGSPREASRGMPAVALIALVLLGVIAGAVVVLAMSGGDDEAVSAPAEAVEEPAPTPPPALAEPAPPAEQAPEAVEATAEPAVVAPPEEPETTRTAPRRRRRRAVRRPVKREGFGRVVPDAPIFDDGF